MDSCPLPRVRPTALLALTFSRPIQRPAGSRALLGGGTRRPLCAVLHLRAFRAGRSDADAEPQRRAAPEHRRRALQLCERRRAQRYVRAAGSLCACPVCLPCVPALRDCPVYACPVCAYCYCYCIVRAVSTDHPQRQLRAGVRGGGRLLRRPLEPLVRDGLVDGALSR